jgi:hypothetical protein
LKPVDRCGRRNGAAEMLIVHSGKQFDRSFGLAAAGVDRD